MKRRLTQPTLLELGLFAPKPKQFSIESTENLVENVIMTQSAVATLPSSSSTICQEQWTSSISPTRALLAPAMNNSAGITVLPEKPHQPDASSILLYTSGGRNLSFQPSWYSLFPWLHVTPDLGAVVCFTCARANSLNMLDLIKRREETFLKSGFRNWKKALEKFQDHQRTECHHFAVSQLQQREQSNPIIEQLLSKKKAEQTQARECLTSLFTSVKYLARQGLPLRGHNNEEGNFMQLLQVIRSTGGTNATLNSWLNRKCDFTSPSIQNEILELFGQQLVRQLAQKVKAARDFAVIVDGTIDVSGKHQESICLRYVDKDLHPHEVFVGLYELPDSRGETIANCVLDVLVRLQLPLENLRGQTYDGASNMSGAYNGCQALIQQKAPLALYVHCGAHCSNLVAQASCENVPFVRDALCAVQELGALFSSSSNLRSQFENLAKQGDISTKKIKPLCPTRWLVRVNAVMTLLQQYPIVIQTLDELGNSKSQAATRARGLHKKLSEGLTVLGLKMALVVLKPLEQLNKSLQSRGSSVSGMLAAVELVSTELRSQKNDKTFEDVLEDTNEIINKLDLDAIQIPRVRRPPSRYSGPAPAFIATSISDHFRPLLFSLIDTAAVGLDERFSGNGDLNLYRKLEDVLLIQIVDECLSAVTSPYATLFDWTSLGVELQMFRKMDYLTLSEASDLLRKMPTEMRNLFTEVEKLVRLLLVCPAATAEAERSFSSLRRLKTWLRSTMLQDRLNHISVCHVHKDLLDEMDTVPLMREFIGRGRPDIRGRIFGHFT